MTIPAESRERIFQVANDLFEEGGREAFPTVADVRRIARVSMNDASAGMREWRREKTRQVAPVAITIPEAVQASGQALLAALWKTAQDTANESLRTAQAGWEIERTEAESLNQQLSDAFDEQAHELEAARQRASDTEAAARKAGEEAAALQERTHAELAQVRATLDAERAARREEKARSDAQAQDAQRELAAARSAQAAAQAEVGVLKNSLEQQQREAQEAQRRAAAVQEAMAKARAELNAMREAAASERQKAQAEAHAATTRLEAAHAEAARLRADVATAREEAAQAAGQALALKEQYTRLLERLPRAIAAEGFGEAASAGNGDGQS